MFVIKIFQTEDGGDERLQNDSNQCKLQVVSPLNRGACADYPECVGSHQN